MYEYEAEVLRVVDADTFDLLVDVGFSITIKKRFRLNGVDAPETWRPKTQAEKEHGEKANAAVREIMPVGKKVTIKSYKEDKYRRYLCDIKVGGTDVAQYLRDRDLVKRESY
jgi:micrococcal nuclease